MELTKKIIGITLFVSIAFKMLMAPIFFVNYELRKDYIIKNYCVNKNRPEMQCNGKCYLAKQIQKAEQEDEKKATNRFVFELFSIESISAEYFEDYFPRIQFTLKALACFDFKESGYSRTQGSIFHPPQV